MAPTILIVDDDPTFAALLKDGLESSGYRVALAQDAASGLRFAREQKPDLVILDYYLPGGDGGGAHARLRAAADTRDIPVIVSTGLTEEEFKEKITSDARTFFMRKPVSFTGILSVVRQALGEASAGASFPEPLPLDPPKSARRKVKHHEFKVRVTYADTDKAGIIYYANYFKYLEQGRTELLRSLGVRYRDLEIGRKIFLPAVEARCEYLAPSRYDDLLVIRTWITELGRASVSFCCEVEDTELSGKIVARVHSRHAVVNDLWRPAKVPEDLRGVLAPFIEHK